MFNILSEISSDPYLNDPLLWWGTDDPLDDMKTINKPDNTSSGIHTRNGFYPKRQRSEQPQKAETLSENASTQSLKRHNTSPTQAKSKRARALSSDEVMTHAEMPLPATPGLEAIYDYDFNLGMEIDQPSDEFILGMTTTNLGVITGETQVNSLEKIESTGSIQSVEADDIGKFRTVEVDGKAIDKKFGEAETEDKEVQGIEADVKKDTKGAECIEVEHWEVDNHEVEDAELEDGEVQAEEVEDEVQDGVIQGVDAEGVEVEGGEVQAEEVQTEEVQDEVQDEVQGVDGEGIDVEDKIMDIRDVEDEEGVGAEDEEEKEDTVAFEVHSDQDRAISEDAATEGFLKGTGARRREEGSERNPITIHDDEEIQSISAPTSGSEGSERDEVSISERRRNQPRQYPAGLINWTSKPEKEKSEERFHAALVTVKNSWATIYENESLREIFFIRTFRHLLPKSNDLRSHKARSLCIRWKKQEREILGNVKAQSHQKALLDFGKALVSFQEAEAERESVFVAMGDGDSNDPDYKPGR